MWYNKTLTFLEIIWDYVFERANFNKMHVLKKIAEINCCYNQVVLTVLRTVCQD